MSTRAKQKARKVHDVLSMATWVLDALGPIDGLRVLEVDCGSGSNLTAALDRGADVWGVDASVDRLRKARDAAPEANLREGVASDLPFDNCLFDAVYSLGVSRTADDAARLARECARVCKIGGVVVLALALAEHSCSSPEFVNSVSDRVTIRAGLWPLSSPCPLMISLKICN